MEQLELILNKVLFY